MRTRLCVLALVLGGSWIVACDDDCGDAERAALEIVVVDSSTGAEICEAVVTVSDGAFEEVFDRDVECEQVPSGVFSAAPGRAGTYSITVTHPDYATPSVPAVVVPSGECGPVTQSVLVEMQPL
ncbi:MAG: hypothetical protein ACAI38_15860 [Myxococcota bacterium]